MARVCSFSGPLSGVGDNNECTFEPQPPNQPCQNHHFSNHEGTTRVIRGPPNLTTVRAGRLHRLPMRLLLSVPSQNKYFCKGQADQTEHNVQPTHTNSFSLSLSLAPCSSQRRTARARSLHRDINLDAPSPPPPKQYNTSTRRLRPVLSLGLLLSQRYEGATPNLCACLSSLPRSFTQFFSLQGDESARHGPSPRRPLARLGGGRGWGLPGLALTKTKSLVRRQAHPQ